MVDRVPAVAVLSIAVPGADLFCPRTSNSCRANSCRGGEPSRLGTDHFGEQRAEHAMNPGPRRVKS